MQKKQWVPARIQEIPTQYIMKKTNCCDNQQIGDQRRQNKALNNQF